MLEEGLEVDPLRWMELDAPALHRWLQDHHGASEVVLDSELRTQLRARLAQLAAESSALEEAVRVGDALFFAQRAAGECRRTLWRDDAGTRTIAFDATQIDAGATVASWRVAYGGEAIAVNVAVPGAEVGTIYITRGTVLPDRISAVHHEFQPAWTADGTALLCTKLDPSSADPVVGMKLWLHRIGAVTDELVFVPQHPIELPWPITGATSPWLAVCVQGPHAGMRVYVVRSDELAGLATPWREICGHDDLVDDVQLAGDQLYVLTSRDAPNRRVEVIDLASGTRAIAVAETTAVIESIAVAADAIYVRDSVGGSSELRRCGRDAIHRLTTPPNMWLSRITSDPRSAGIVAAIDDWMEPTRLIAYDGDSLAPRELGIAAAAPIGRAAFVAERLEVASHDGELVPLTILRPRDVAVGGASTLLEAYGGYGMSLTPAFDPVRLAWLERGGVYAIAHVRGGGEKGRAWHLAGRAANKRNSVADFVACARELCARGYTQPRRLGATGLSMGGVVIGGAVIDSPELFGAAAIHAGLLNATRYLHGVNGEPQRAELGSPDDEAGYRALLAMDVYRQLRDDVRYPPLLITLGLNDERVSPWMSAKVAARLAAAGNEVFVRVDHDGHGMTATSAQRARRLADTWAFFATRLQ
ncbi:MAG: prolyl oligopeptidase family serine peptidase [Kofleriaceae bacterium]